MRASVVVACGLSSCGSRALECRLSRRTGLVAPQHVGSSWTRDRARVPCIGRRILNHCATREVPPPTVSLHDAATLIFPKHHAREPHTHTHTEFLSPNPSRLTLSTVHFIRSFAKHLTHIIALNLPDNLIEHCYPHFADEKTEA